MDEEKRSIFVYGTLKRGGSNHALIAGQRFLGDACTLPGFTLHEIYEFPGMVRQADDRLGVEGEVWQVDRACLAVLDALEGLDEGLYERVPIPLAPPFDGSMIDAYLFLPPVNGFAHIGPSWPSASSSAPE